MARIVYFQSPIDESQVVDITSRGTLGFALKELGLENRPVQVSINGMTPDELSLDLVLEDTDVVEIKHVVHGGGNSDSKSGLALIVQIAAIAAATYLTAGGYAYWAAAVSVGGMIASGALNKWANDLMSATAPTTSEQEVNSQTNNYSAKTANNTARPLSPLIIPLGSHKYAPDVHADAYITRYRIENTQNIGAPYINYSRVYGILSSNGPMVPNNSWITMPANYISPGTPEYEIKISPYGIVTKTTALTSAENIAACEVVKNWFLDGVSAGTIKTNLYAYSFGAVGKAIMPVAYHSSPSDPYLGRFNFLYIVLKYSHLRYYLSASVTWSDLGSIFSGTLDATKSNQFFLSNVSSVANDPLTITTTSSDTLPTGARGYSSVQRRDEFRNILLSVNDGVYTSTPKTVSYPSQEILYSPTIVQKFSGIPVSTQIFNFGIGDLLISDIKVGDFSIGPSDGILENRIINKTGPDKWMMPTFNKFSQNFRFYEDVRNFPAKELSNQGLTPHVVSVSDHGRYNFVYYSGKYTQDTFSFAFKGRLYRTSPTGFAANTTHVQVQYKLSGDTTWRNLNILGSQYEVITLENNNTQDIYLKYEFSLTSPQYNRDQYLEVRIRKVTLDSVDNKTISSSDSRVSMLSVADAAFTTSEISMDNNNLFELNRPMNLEGLAIDSLISDTARSNQFTATVQSKCWVYNFNSDSWLWTESRNPAFWFLYFARGGFENPSADGGFSYPYSPTYGWVNYPGHPNNISHIFGAGLYDEEIDIDKILEWAYFCEENNLKIDMVLRDDTSVADVLERIANIGRASSSYYNGKLSVVIEDQDQVPVCLFGMGNIIAGSFSVDYAVADPIRKVKGTFTNRETWETDTVESIVPFSDPENVKELEITLDGITERQQAQREINILAARQFFQKRTYKWQTDVEGYIARRGDLVYLSHDSTQYGFSGRVIDFIVESGNVIGIRTGSNLDSSIQYVSVRRPSGEIDTYTCEFDSGIIKFTENYPMEYASFYVNQKDENLLSEFPNSIPEDFVFIADVKQTTGKKVRISQIQSSEDGVFTITAVDEDPAMWAYEYNDPEEEPLILDPESFEDSAVIVTVDKLTSKDLGNGKVRLDWEVDGADSVMIVDLYTNLPLESNGQYSFTDGTVVLELVSGVNYHLEVRPLAYGTPFKSVTARIKLWPL